MRKPNTASLGLIALALAGVYLLLNGIGWAAVFFWKSEIIVWCMAIPAAVLCPLGTVTVVPGSQADSPLSFIPLMAICFILWAIAFEALWRSKKRKPNQVSAFVARAPKPSTASSAAKKRNDQR